MSISEACRIVGIHKDTGKHWRHGRTVVRPGGRRYHYPPVVIEQKSEISPRYLSEDERTTIADLRRAGRSMRAIAAEVGRDVSTISRELRRNRDPASSQYRPFTAQRLATGRRARPGRGKLIRDPELRAFVAARLKKRWSPEQISRALRDEFPDQPERQLVPETIYQAVYRPELGGLHREVPKALRTGRRRPPALPQVRTGPSPDDPHDIVYFQRHKADDPSRSTPAREFLELCPTGVRAKFRAVLIAVAAAPPKRFAGGGYREAMKGDMTGWHEVRVDGPGWHHYRLFCLLDYDAKGRDKRLLVVVTGMDKPFRTTFSSADYAAVKALGDEYRRRNPRSVA